MENFYLSWCREKRHDVRKHVNFQLTMPLIQIRVCLTFHRGGFMRMTSFVSVSVVAIALAVTMTSVQAERSSKVDVVKPSPVTSGTSQLATLKDVKAVPMASGELDAVKGMHVHFLDGGGGKEHLAGVHNMSN